MERREGVVPAGKKEQIESYIQILTLPACKKGQIDFLKNTQTL